jgi:hypothetical protein
VEGKTILVDDVLTTLQQLALYHRNSWIFLSWPSREATAKQPPKS